MAQSHSKQPQSSRPAITQDDAGKISEETWRRLARHLAKIQCFQRKAGLTGRGPALRKAKGGQRGCGENQGLRHSGQ